MLQVDGGTLKAIAQHYHGVRAATQDRVVSGIGPILSETLGKYEINTPLRIAHFLAQMCHECADFTAVDEQGEQSYFKQYENRNGNSQPGDGYKFRGRGLIQLTFKSNYEQYGNYIKVDLLSNPDLASEPKNALLIACEYWKHKSLNDLADQDDIIDITKKINGGQNGIDSRRKYLSKAKDVLAGLSAKSLSPDRLPAASSSDSSHVDPILHRGCTDPEVADLQRFLGRVGYKVTVDGIFGHGTEVAVVDFQKNNGLSSDGIVGQKTWNQLRAKAA